MLGLLGRQRPSSGFLQRARACPGWGFVQPRRADGVSDWDGGPIRQMGPRGGAIPWMANQSSTERSQKAQSRTRTHDPSLPKPVLLTTELSELLNASLHRFYWSGLIWHRGSAEPHSSGGMAESSSASSPSMSGTSASSESPSRHPSEGSAIHVTAWPDGWPDCDGVGHAVEGSSKTESTQAQLISSARPLGIELWFLGAGAIYRE